MGQEILYCLECRTRLRGQDFDRGQAFRLDNLAYCSGCTSVALKSLPPDKVARLLKEIATHGGRRDDRPPSTRRLPAPAGTPKASRVQVEVKSGGRGGVIAGAFGGVVVLVAGILFFWLAGRDPLGVPPSPPEKESPRLAPPTADPGPLGLQEEARRRGEEALKKAREFARTRPDDFAAQAPLFELAVQAAQGTPVETDAKRELQAVQARLQAALKARETLFNGKDLTGWEQHKGVSTVRDGAIHVNTEGSDPEQGSFLSTAQSYSHYDFSCRLQAVRADRARLYFEVQVPSRGRIFSRGIPAGDGWHDLKIRARGGKVEVWFDGIPMQASGSDEKDSGTLGFFVKQGVLVLKDVLLQKVD